MISAACQQDVVSAKKILNRMQAEGVVPTMRHIHPILRAYAQGGAVELLEEELLVELYLSDKVKIDVECFNILIRGLIDTRDRGYGYEMMDKLRYTIPGQLKRAGLRPNARFYALQAEAHVDMDDFEHMREAGISFRKMGRRASRRWRKLSTDALLKRLHTFEPGADEDDRDEVIRRLRNHEAMAEYAAGRLATDFCPMEDQALTALLWQQAVMAPEDLEKSLDVLHQSGWQLPPLAMQPDDEGLTLVACWLKTSLSRLRSNRLADVEAPMTGSIAVEDISEAAFEDSGDVSREFLSSLGTTYTVDQSGALLDLETGKVKPASKLSTLEIQAELEARGLMTSGSRKEMYKRLQAARRSPPASLEATKLRERRMYQKYQSQRKRNEDTRAEARALREPQVDMAEMSGYGKTAGGVKLNEEADDTSALSLEPSLLGLASEDGVVVVDADEDADADDDDDDDDDDDEDTGRKKSAKGGSDDEDEDDLADDDDDERPALARSATAGAVNVSTDEEHVRGGVEAETDELSAYDRMIESGGALMDDKHSRFIEHLQTLALMKNTSKTQFSLPREETEWAARQLTQGTDTGMVILRHIKNLGGEPTFADIATLVLAAEAEESYEYFGDLLSEVSNFLVLEGDAAPDFPSDDPSDSPKSGSLLTFAATAGFSDDDLKALAHDAAEWVANQDRSDIDIYDADEDEEGAFEGPGEGEGDEGDAVSDAASYEDEDERSEPTGSNLIANDDAYAMQKEYDDDSTQDAADALQQLQEEGGEDLEGAAPQGTDLSDDDTGEDFTVEDIKAALYDETELTDKEMDEALDSAAEMSVNAQEMEQLYVESVSEAAWEVINRMTQTLLQGSKTARTPQRQDEVLQMAENFRTAVIENGCVLTDLVNMQLDYRLKKRDAQNSASGDQELENSQDGLQEIEEEEEEAATHSTD